MLAKGKVFVTTEKLAELFSLPEGVEIIAIKPKGGVDEGFEFLVMSAEETVCTKKDIPMSQMRRVSVDTLEKNKNGEHPAFITGGYVKSENVPFPEVGSHRENIISNSQVQLIMDALGNIEIKSPVVITTKHDEKDVKELFEDILKVAKSKGVR